MNLVNWQTAEGQRETMCRRDFTDLTNFWVAVRVTRQLQRAGSIWTSCKVFCPRANFCQFVPSYAREGAHTPAAEGREHLDVVQGFLPSYAHEGAEKRKEYENNGHTYRHDTVYISRLPVHSIRCAGALESYEESYEECNV